MCDATGISSDPSLLSNPESPRFIVRKETIKGETLAVKSATDSQLVPALKREAELIRKLSTDDRIRSHIVEVIEYNNNKMYMRFYECSDVVGFLEGGKALSEADALKMLREILFVLAVMHGQGCIHRDIKPDNILVDRQGSELVFRLTDFDLATWPGENPNAKGVGSHWYWAPEIWLQWEYSEKSDIFALAVTVMAARSGKLLTYQQPDWDELVAEWCQVCWSDLQIQQLAQSMLCEDPCRRPTAMSALAAVDSFVEPDYEGAIWQGVSVGPENIV